MTWRVVVRDWTGSTILVPDLLVLDGHAQLRGIQQGLIPPSSAVGSMTLQLMSAKGLDALAQTQPARAAQIRADHALLSQEARVEAYFPGRRNPFFTGRLRTPHEDPDNYSWDCIDNTQDLVDGKTEKQQRYHDVSSNVFKATLQDYLLIYGDDFATADLIVQDGTATAWGQYSAANGTSVPSADPSGRTWTPATGPGGDWPGAAITNLTAGRNYSLVEPGNTPAYLQWTPAMIEGSVVIVADANAKKVSGGLLLGYVHAPGNPQDGNRITAQVTVDVTAGAGGLAVLTLSLSSPGGGRSEPAQFSVPWTGGTIAADGSYTLDTQIRVYTSALGFQVLCDGQEINGAAWPIANAAWGRSVGFFAANRGTGVGGQVFVSDLYYFEKRPLFAEGAITPTTTVRDHGPFAEAQLLEVGALMASQEGFDMRKNPLPGMDSFDYAPTIGSNTGIIFSESRRGSITAGGSTATPTLDAVNGIGIGTTLTFLDASAKVISRQVVQAVAGNVVTVPVVLVGAVSYQLAGRITKGYPKNERNQMKLASELRISGRGSGSSAEVYVARSLAAMRKYGRLSRSYSQPDVASFSALRKVGQGQMDMASQPNLGRTVEVDMSGHEGDIRELDTAVFDAPWAGLTMSVRQVMGMDLSMKSTLWVLYLDQYPDHLLLTDYQQMLSAIDKIAGGMTAYSAGAQPGIQQTAAGLAGFRA